ncbi:MAG: DsbA family oxidoreductase [Hyphomonadaceae bacterium]|nr:DsbA family oxidoreductase [Hyphomonadaceae bacterium]
MTTPLRIDFVSDVACPWCVIGLRSLQTALHALEGEVAAELHLQPFELNPNMAPEGENTFEHVQKKYGSTPERSAAARNALKQSGEALGFEFRHSPDSRIWNTFDAHRLLHWAGLEGRQVELKQALFKANFTDNLPLNDAEVLANAAAAAGLDADRARQILASDQFADVVRQEEELWRSRGIQAVPSIVIENRWLIQGGQAPEVFEAALRKIAAELSTAPTP